jgi:hypothetical protein
MIRDAKKFTIKRSQWIQGQESRTKLVDDDGNKDCIGFFWEASGLDSSQMVGLDEPIDVLAKHQMESKLIKRVATTYLQSDICTQIIAANDDSGISIGQRERVLQSLFASIGVALNFED